MQQIHQSSSGNKFIHIKTTLHRLMLIQTIWVVVELDVWLCLRLRWIFWLTQEPTQEPNRTELSRPSHWLRPTRLDSTRLDSTRPHRGKEHSTVQYYTIQYYHTNTSTIADHLAIILYHPSFTLHEACTHSTHLQHVSDEAIQSERDSTTNINHHRTMAWNMMGMEMGMGMRLVWYGMMEMVTDSHIVAGIILISYINLNPIPLALHDIVLHCIILHCIVLVYVYSLLCMRLTGSTHRLPHWLVHIVDFPIYHFPLSFALSVFVLPSHQFELILLLLLLFLLSEGLLSPQHISNKAWAHTHSTGGLWR